MGKPKVILGTFKKPTSFKTKAGPTRQKTRGHVGKAKSIFGKTKGKKSG